MTNDTMTPGRFIDMAHKGGQSVSVLVQGHWVSGMVTGRDDYGVMLTGDDGQVSVTRVIDISSVKVHPSMTTAEVAVLDAISA